MAFTYHQVFCDESGKHQNDPVIAFCSVVSTEDRLSAFDSDWRSLLRSYEMDYLHMAQASRRAENVGYRMKKEDTIEERTELLIPFADCINKHLEIGLIQAWHVRGFNRLSTAVMKTLGGQRDPYFLAFIRGLTELVHRIGEDDRISIIFDDDRDTAWDCYNHFRAIGEADPEVQKKAVSISFANDRHFPALQAADMVSFLARKEADERFNQVTNIWGSLYGRLTTEPQPQYGIMRWLELYADEENLVKLAREAQKKYEGVNHFLPLVFSLRSGLPFALGGAYIHLERIITQNAAALGRLARF
jgi:hypothetical protein